MVFRASFTLIPSASQPPTVVAGAGEPPPGLPYTRDSSQVALQYSSSEIVPVSIGAIQSAVSRFE